MRQRALGPGARKRHSVRLATVPAGTWRAEVCAVPRADRNDCATGKQRLTSDPAPRRSGPYRPRPPRRSRRRPRRPRRNRRHVATDRDGHAGTDRHVTADRDGHAAGHRHGVTHRDGRALLDPDRPADPRDAATAYRQNLAHDGRAFGDGPQPPLTTVWTRDLDGNLGYPLIAGGRVFALTDKGMLRVLDLRNGALLWSHAIGTSPVSAAFDDGRVLTTDESG